ncbi:MAG TPA: hypothetical protein VEZ90_18165, partial [Blastocatellia bacterium]|nr:hypothetical protein [Blastocatellia bacterium]
PASIGPIRQNAADTKTTIVRRVRKLLSPGALIDFIAYLLTAVQLDFRSWDYNPEGVCSAIVRPFDGRLKLRLRPAEAGGF